MALIINGKSEDIQGSVVLDVLKAKKIDPHMVTVELNDTIIEPDQLGTVPLREGDRLDLLFYMGGGL